jgi:hypothetical protein
MEWQAVVLAVQILLLAAGWLLFQRARGELSARAAESPVLAEAKELQSGVKQLLAEIESTADRQSLRIERACSDAGAILAELENMILDAESCLAQLEQTTSDSSIRPTRSENYAVTPTDGPGSSAARYSRESPTGLRSLVRQETEPALINSSVTPVATRDTVMVRRDMVFALADSGESPAAIARTTRISEGEVETLLGLRIQR